MLADHHTPEILLHKPCQGLAQVNGSGGQEVNSRRHTPAAAKAAAAASVHLGGSNALLAAKSPLLTSADMYRTPLLTSVMAVRVPTQTCVVRQQPSWHNSKVSAACMNSPSSQVSQITLDDHPGSHTIPRKHEAGRPLRTFKGACTPDAITK